MKTNRGIACLIASLFTVGVAGLGGCGGGGYSSPSMTPSPTPSPSPSPAPSPGQPSGMNFSVTNLVSNGTIPAAHTDPNLINAWGIVFNPAGFVWVADNGTSKSTLYDGNGVPQSLVVSIPPVPSGDASPTGIVFNSSQDFKVSQGAMTAASPFIFASEAGTISGWSPSVNPTVAVTVFDGSSTGTVYKGLALSSSYLGLNHIYATDFHNNKVDVFDGNFTKVTLPGGFVDSTLPSGYAPYGIQAIGSIVFVSFAQQDPQAHDEVKGAGLGIIDEFDGAGTFIKRLVTGGALNAGWGMAMAPSNFGAFSNDLLVSNFGDGKINAFDPATGTLIGTLSKSDGTAIVINGLWGIAFGNGINSQPTNTLFFTAGPADEAQGLYGRIDISP